MEEEKKIRVESEGEEEECAGKTEWQKPTLEDVSLKIMAQPYIRFT